MRTDGIKLVVHVNDDYGFVVRREDKSRNQDIEEGKVAAVDSQVGGACSSKVTSHELIECRDWV